MKSNNLDPSSSKVNWKGVFGVASVWFGAHVGGGFATGNQTMNFFVKEGWYTLWMPILIIGIIALVYRETMLMARNYNAYDYRTLSKKLYEPYDKVLSIVFEVCYIIIVLLATGGSIAGAAALFSDFGLSYNLGVVITGTILFILTIFGANLIRKASTLMTVIIVICLTLICYIGITANSGNFINLTTTGYTTESIWNALWLGLKYAGFQAIVWSIIISVSQPLKTDKDINNTTIVGFILNSVMIVLSCMMLFAWLPGTSGETLPILYICKQLGQDWLVLVYTIVLLLAFISTGISCVFGAITRFETLIKVPENITVRRGLLSLCCMVLSMAISLFGLTAIVQIGYGYTGILGIFVVIIPVLTVGHMKNKKFKNEHQNVVEEEI
ncbi:YkvI family membrane protein [Metaclostridioides mangenotii]|uniref:Membrane protein YkvI n=1 Tax=Metaclostridioides mangenotii TaxID=1540 RepID=A0ABS4ECT0_9FIRM|nr:hypothetical protein [Clostridioides mangenotii]MBP1855757.1 putative membrane protein YkvI [Clostridioides mangenotii]